MTDAGGSDRGQLDRTHLHVPVPGELVSPVSGSALVTVARGLGRACLDSGGQAAFVARAGLPHRPAPLGLIEAPMPDRVWLTRGERVRDLATGAVSGRRPGAERLWGPIYDAIPSGHQGPVFLHNAPAAAAGLRRRRPDSMAVVHLHNDVTRGWPRYARAGLVRRNRVVCVSRFLAGRLLPGGVERGAVLALVNGADVAAFTPAAVEPEPTVLFVGKVVPHKGPDLLVEAALLLHERGLRFRLHIVGSSVLSAGGGLSDFETRLRARAAPLADRVWFTPFVDRDGIAAVYRDATIMVVPSDWDEPCSLTLPEGMAAGLACVASRRGGLPEVGGAAPLYFDPPDVRSLAEHLHRLLTDPDELGARAAAARDRAEEISWDRQFALLEDWLARGSSS